MDLQKNEVFTQDMRQIGALPLMEELRGRTVAVTGATGLIGQTIVSALLRCSETDAAGEKKEPVQVIACVRNEEKARRMKRKPEGSSAVLTMAICSFWSRIFWSFLSKSFRRKWIT